MRIPDFVKYKMIFDPKNSNNKETDKVGLKLRKKFKQIINDFSFR